jgi:sugar phosphate isomerase/epimerase
VAAGIPDLIGCFWTLGGAYVFGDDDRSPWDFRDRAEAAGRAGYRGIGLKHADLMATLERWRFGEIRAILADNGLIHLELEALFDWYEDGEKRLASDRVRRDLLAAAAELGAHHVKAAGGFGEDATRDIVRMHDCFQALAADAVAAGTIMALEPIAFSNIPDLGTAFFVLGDAAGRGAGLMLDSWHVTRGGFPFADIAALPARFIAGAELDDGTIATVGTPIADTLDRRRLCGEGEFDLRGFIAAIRATGYDGPWGVEIISEEQRARPLDEAARRSFETTAAQFR